MQTLPKFRLSISSAILPSLIFPVPLAKKIMLAHIEPNSRINVTQASYEVASFDTKLRKLEPSTAN